MRNLFIFPLLVVFAVAALGQSRTPINRGFLQSNLDGNTYGITNLGHLTVTGSITNQALSNAPAIKVDANGKLTAQYDGSGLTNISGTVYDGGSLTNLASLAPFLQSDANGQLQPQYDGSSLTNISGTVYDGGSLTNLASLAPFLQSDANGQLQPQYDGSSLTNISGTVYDGGSLTNLASPAPFLKADANGELQPQYDGNSLTNLNLPVLYDGGSLTNLGGTNTSYTFLYIPAAAFTLATNNAAAWGTNIVSTNFNDVICFDDTTAERATVSFPLMSWTLEPLQAKVYMTAAGAAAPAVFGLSIGAIGHDESLNVGFGTEQKMTNTWAGTADALDISDNPSADITVGSSPAKGNLLQFRLARIPSDTGDTLVGDACVLGLLIRYPYTNNPTW